MGKGYEVSSRRMVSQTGSACPTDTKLAMIEWFGPILVESYGGSESGTLCRIDSREWLAHRGSVGRPRPPYEGVGLTETGHPLPPHPAAILGFRAPQGGGPRYHPAPQHPKTATPPPAPFTRPPSASAHDP